MELFLSENLLLCQGLNLLNLPVLEFSFGHQRALLTYKRRLSQWMREREAILDRKDWMCLTKFAIREFLHYFNY